MNFLFLMFGSTGNLIAFLGAMAIVVWVSYLFVKKFLDTLKQRKREYEELDKPVKPADVDLYNVTVVDKYIDVVRSGSYKMPHSRSAFFVTFLLENGKKRTYEVDERYFRRIKNGSKGELAVADGKFIGFSRKR